MVPVQLQYDAAEGCPTQAEFVARVESRGGDFARPSPNGDLRVLRVSLQREQTRHTGTLKLGTEAGDSDPRLVRADSCTDAADALAIVAALALRGAQESGGEAAPEAPTEPEPHASPAVVAPSPAPSPPTPRAPANTRLRELGAWGGDSLKVTSGELKLSRSRVATLSGGVVLGAVPNVVIPRYDLSLMTTSFIATPQGTSYLFGGIFGVRWSYLGKATHRDGSHVTTLSGFKAGVDMCRSVTYDTAGFVALLCAGFAVGVMSLDTREAAEGYRRTKEIGLGTASLDLRTRYNVSQHFNVGLSAGGELWVSRLTAERADGTELFRSRLFNANVQLGLGVQF